MREMFFFEEAAEPSGRGIYLVRDREAIFLRQPFAIRSTDRIRELLDRAEIGRMLRRQLQLVVDLLDYVADGHLPLDDARLLAFLETPDRSVDVDDEVLVPLQIVFVVGQRVERRS